MPNGNAISILKTGINQVGYDDVLALFREWIKKDEVTRTVVAANVHLVTEAALNPEYAKVIDDATLVVPDGMPLVWASRLLGGNLSDRCYGPTLMEKTLDSFQTTDASHFFYGSTPEVLEKLLIKVRERWPDAKIAGAYSPPFGAFNEQEDLKNISRINDSGATFVWVGMGCPKQEQWMHLYRQSTDSKILLAVGAAFDFIAGTVPQAPRVFQRSGLEWLYRFAMEPKRLWKRYLFRNPYFIAMFIGQYLQYLLKRCTSVP